MRKVLPLAALVLFTGCGVDPGPKADPVEVTGKVTAGGKPVGGVVLNLHVLTTGSPATIPLAAGDFKVTATPGRYTWYLSEGKSAAAFKAIPAKFREPSMDRAFDVGPGSTLDLKVE